MPGFSLVDNVVLDYMHLVLEEVVQKIIRYWINTKNPTKLPTGLITVINERLSKCSEYIPTEFQRSANENSKTHFLVKLIDGQRQKVDNFYCILVFCV